MFTLFSDYLIVSYVYFVGIRQLLTPSIYDGYLVNGYVVFVIITSSEAARLNPSTG
jgi:hypothetical protein